MGRKLEKKIITKLATFVCLATLLPSCIVDSVRDSRGGIGGEALENSKESVRPGYGRVLLHNPIALAGYGVTENTDLSTLITRTPLKITDNEYLEKDCNDISECLLVTKEAGVSPFENVGSRWGYSVYSTEFLQINSFYHTSQLIDTYLGNVKSYDGSSVLSFNQTTSIPSTIYNNEAYWQSPSKKTLKVHADDSTNKDNASYFASENLISLGYLSSSSKVKMGQDSSLIAHEFGHMVVDRLMNIRNRNYDTIKATTLGQSTLGYFPFDEAKSINEGISDYYSYFNDDREHFAEWSLGLLLKASRPISEADSSHTAGVSTDEDSRVSYPEFLGYDANNPDTKALDIHADGQIISHFLVALTKELHEDCTTSNDNAKKLVFNILTESLAELGDLSAQAIAGVDNFQNQINLDQNYSTEWLKSVNPINFRKFAQSIGRKALFLTSAGTTYCPKGNYTQDKLETLLDSYGLLLFRTYNTDYNSLGVQNTVVNQLNRKKTELISKNLLVQDVRSQYSNVSIYDNQSSVLQTIKNLISIEELTTTNAQYNNGNGIVSPGEIVGIYANIFNNSNSTMAGARVLASDWAHMQDGLPCSNLSDNFPSSSQGGTTCDPLTSTNYADQGRIMPVCMLTYNDGTSSKLINQHEFLKEMKSDIGLLEQDCLGQSTSKTQDELNNCFVKALPSANTQNISRISPKSNWSETYTDVNGTPQITDANLMFFEINKNIPLGTQVTCRLRTSFTNCDDCYHNIYTDGFGNQNIDDFEDYMFAGEEPFNILTIKFTVGQ